MSKLGEEGKIPENKGFEKKEAEVVRDWTIAEQLRHPAGIVSLQWTPGSLQRGETCHHYCLTYILSMLRFGRVASL